MSDPLITVKDVTKRFGSVVALKRVGLSLRTGEFHGIIGPNGSGKTTLFRIIAGLARPSEGRVDREATTIGYSFQEPRFYPHLTVRENLDVFRSLGPASPPPGWTAELVDQLRLKPVTDRLGRELSGGSKKKLDLALAFVKRPDVVLLDEPFADIDDQSRTFIRDFIDDYHREGHAVVVSTHHIVAFAPLFDRVTILVDGERRFHGDPEGDVVAQYYAQLQGQTAQSKEPSSKSTTGGASEEPAPTEVTGPTETEVTACPRCGVPVPPTARFCQACGEDLP